MSETDKPSGPAAGGLGSLQSDVLAGTTHTRSDLRAVARAVNEGWIVPADARPELVERLREIVRKRTVKRWVGGGEMGPMPVDDEERADVNSIKAGSVLVSMSPPTAKHEHEVKATILAAVLPRDVQDAI